MARRYCTSCGTKLMGKLGHGIPASGGRLLCGRSEVQKTVTHTNGNKALMFVKTPRCLP